MCVCACVCVCACRRARASPWSCTYVWVFGSVAHVRITGPTKSASKLNSKLSGLRPVGLLGRSCRAPTASASLPRSASPATCLCRWVLACVGVGSFVCCCAWMLACVCAGVCLLITVVGRQRALHRTSPVAQHALSRNNRTQTNTTGTYQLEKRANSLEVEVFMLRWVRFVSIPRD